MAELTQKEIRREQERLRLIQEQNEAAKELLSTYEKQKKVTGALTNDEKDIVNLTRDLNNLSTELGNSIQKRLSGTSSLKDLEGQLKKLKQENINFEDNAIKLSQAKLQAQQKAQDLDTNLIRQARLANNLENQLAIELRAQRDIEEELAELAGSRNRADKERIRELRREKNLVADTIKEAQERIKEKEKEVELARKLSDEQYNLVTQINKTIEANEKTKEQLAEELVLLQQAVQVKKKEEVYDVLKEKFNTKQITDLLIISGITEAIVDGMFQFDKTSVAISKNIGYGADKADEMALKMQAISVFSLASNLTMKNMAEAMGQLNEATGFVADYSKDALETQIMLTKQFGLTGEEASGIYKLSVLTGKSSEKVNDEMVGAFVAARNASGAGIPFKESIAAAAKVSGQLKANLQANPAGIVKAVVAVKALGTTLEQTAAQGEKLLEFGSSLESELKAELLTGKQLNLERARAAALAGDQVTLAEELNKNIGTYDDFTKMNVLQQKALAESVGLTANELANQLEKQKLAQAAGKSLAEFTKDEALEAQKRKEIQQSFNDLVEKLQNLLGTIGALFAPLLSLITNILDQSGLVYVALGGWLIYTKLLGKDFKSLGGSIKDIAKTLGSKVFGKGASGVSDSITSSRGLTLTKKATGAGETLTESVGGKAKGLADKAPEGGANKGKGIKQFLTGLAGGLKAFGKNAGDVLKGAATLALSAVLIGGALVGIGLAFQALGGDPMVLVGLGAALAGFGISAALLGKFSSEIMKGAVAMLVLGAAMIPFAFALSLIAGLNMEDILAAGAGLLIFGAAIVGLGALIMSGVGAVLFGAGILGMLALGAAMIVLGAGLKVVASAGKDISGLFASLTTLDTDKLDKISPALKSIGEGILALGAGSVLSAIGNLLGGGPVEMLQGIANTGDGIQKAATSLLTLAGALTGVSVALASIDISKLEALSDFSLNQSSNAITSTITSPIKAIGEAIGGGDKEINSGIDLTPMIVAINEVKASIDRLYNKDQSINMDGKKVGTTLVQGSYKVA